MPFIRPVFLLIFISFFLSASCVIAQNNKVLHGQVNEQGYQLPPVDNFGGSAGPSLSPKDLERSGDPFGSPSNGIEDQALDAPKQAFAMPPKSKTPKKKFGLNAEKEDSSGTKLPGNVDAMSQPTFQPQVPQSSPESQVPPEVPLVPQSPTAPQNPINNDPDNSREMQLAWDAWHHRVAEAIFQRFNFLANAAFQFSPPLGMQISYEVTRDGKIQNVQILQRSANVVFDTMVVQCIRSIDGDQVLLRFPEGSHRFMVEQSPPFTWNCGPGGFKFTTGDRETIPRNSYVSYWSS